MKLKKILKESNAPGYKDRKFGQSLPTLDSVKKAYEAKQGKEPVDERLDRSTAQRMDGLHNMKAMKQMIVAAKVIQKDLDDEGFENDEILEFVVDRIRRAAF